ncbi:MAG TPA: adenosylmethionine decarboxylase [Nanoarchaeota archaeon]|nr:adenosylmethionine decarboxylase [Nanoarchaeota archaeon]
MSVHIIADFFGVKAELIKYAEKMKLLLDPIVFKAGLTILDSKYHQFKPFGVSCIYLLAESHVSVHTWPEVGYMAIDIFTCGDEEKAFKCFELLQKTFNPKKVKKQVILRNYYKNLPKQEV